MSNRGTPSALASCLEHHLTSERLGPYRAAAGDLDSAIGLYEWNAQVGAALLEVLGHFEVILRNALAGQLRDWHAVRRLPGEWYHDPLGVLGPRRAVDIQSALDHLRRDRKRETPGQVIARLPFGFWRFLLGRRYQPTLWTQALRRTFPGLRSRRRTDVFIPVDELGRLRNRIAHHEPIHQLHLPHLHDNILRISGYMHPDLRVWIAQVSRVPDVLRHRP